MDENLVKNIQCYAANLLFQIMFFGLLIASVEPAVRRDRVSGSNTKTEGSYYAASIESS